MKRKVNVFFLSYLLLIPFYSTAQDISTVNLVNVGLMYVGNNGGTSIYIPQAVRMVGPNVNIVQDGTTQIGGDFYHDATTHIFVTDANGIGTGTGVISFFDNVANPTKKRYITTSVVNISTFDRASHYVAFPTIRLDSQDTLVIPGKMGIDAKKLETPSSGVLLLQSTVYGGTVVSDASLRLTGSGSSESLAPLGSVIIERDLILYRPSAGDAPLFAYATPFKSQRSGYFAGNWVRKLLRDEASYGHTQYVYGNRSTNGVVIDKEQYLYNPLELFEVNKGYLIKARPLDFDFQQLINSGGLAITGAGSAFYDQNKFIFNGSVYTLPQIKEQVFAENTLFNRSLNQSSPLGKTINWIIGNSYTSAIDVKKLVTAMDASGLVFDSNIYVFPAGSTTYQPHSINGSLQVLDLNEIPAMSIFMIRLDKNSAQTGNFTIGKNITTHGILGNNLRASEPQYENEVLFTVTPENNHNIFDLVAIGIRDGAKETVDNQDIPKVYLSANNAFQLYSLSGEGSKLSANALPKGSTSAKLCFTPGATTTRMRLHVDRQESLSDVWLEDLITRQKINLKETDEYVFNSNPLDISERFIVYFLGTATGMENIIENHSPDMFYSNDEIVINGLESGDLGSVLWIVDTQGRKVQETVINQYPEMKIQVNLSKGIYIAKFTGQHNITIKFIK